MSGGYTPVFGHQLFSGSLSGQYPDTAAWVFLLALADKHGVVDMTPQYISRVTGMPLADLEACIARFLEPDPASRTPANEGRRLELIDASRTWGWRILNFAHYRERARKGAWDAGRTASGKDAARKRAERKEAKESTPAFHKEVIDAYHEILPCLPRVKGWSKRRRQALDARIAERKADGKPADTIAYWRSLFETVAQSDLLCGRAGEWRADLEWLLKPENFLKTIEGRYASRRGGSHAS